MITEGLRLYGKYDIRLERFELPPIKDDEILAKVVSDSLCMSSYKAVVQGEDHKRVPRNIAETPILLGHECCGVIEQVGERWKGKFSPGQKFVLQPALNYKGRVDAPGYSFPYIGGCATYIIIPSQVMEQDCLLPYNADAFFYGSLAEPISCVIGSFKEMFHTVPGVHRHDMGIKEGGSLAILAGAGPMGLGAVDFAVHCDRRPSRLVVTDIDQLRLDAAQKLLSPEDAAKYGVSLEYVNTRNIDNTADYLIKLNNGKGYDDIMVMAPVKSVVELADAILGNDGCLSFFAGPVDTGFKAEVNFYNVHYNSTHFIGTVGGNSEDMAEAVDMMERGIINPAVMITHIGGLDAAADATLNLPNIPGGKKLIYTHIKMELTAIRDFAEKGKRDPLFAKLSEIVEKNNGLWCAEAEKFLLKNKTL